MSTFRYEPPEPPRRIATKRAAGSDLHLGRTVSHLEKGGVPVNPAVLTSIQRNLKSGLFIEDRNALATELKQDPGLFTHCLRNLSHTGLEDRALTDPFTALAVLEEEKLRALFNSTATSICNHKLSTMNKSQALRLEQTIISSHTAEALATKVELDAGVTYSSAHLRQLALDLIAWNYPQIYAKALTTSHIKRSDLGTELQKTLGVSLLQIASRISGDWNLSPELRRAVAPPLGSQAVQKAELEQGGRLSIDTICQIAELFAKAHDRDHFPEAAAEWDAFEPALSERFGADFFEAIEQEIVDTGAQYAHEAPVLLSTPFFRTAIQQSPPTATLLGEQNPFAQRCPEPLRQGFEKAYALSRPGVISVDAIRVLVDEVIPQTPFARGCLYLLSPDRTNLKPTLRVGDVELSGYQAIAIDQEEPMAECFTMRAPLQWHSRGIRGDLVTRIAGNLASEEHPGVLYLESEQSAASEDTHSITLFFHAIRKALIDFLSDRPH